MYDVCHAHITSIGYKTLWLSFHFDRQVMSFARAYTTSTYDEYYVIDYMDGEYVGEYGYMRYIVTLTLIRWQMAEREKRRNSHFRYNFVKAIDSSDIWRMAYAAEF